MQPIVWYISGHGFGHASREIEIINALRDRRPDIPIVVRTGAKRWLFDLTLRSAVEFQQTECDTGIVQIDSLRLDEEATVRRAAAFYADFDAKVEAERDVLASLGPALVIGDVPPLAFAAAHAAGIPSIAIANFTWDWIYEGYEPERFGAPDLVEQIRDACAHAGLFLRLPMWGGFEMAPPEATRDLPLVARRSAHSPMETRKALGLPCDRTLVLLSFGGHGLKGLSPAAFDTFGDDFVAVLTGHLEMSEAARQSRRGVVEFDERGLYDAGWRYEDLVAAVDVVATKPGYGIIAECAAHQTALLYTSRGHFIEYEVLVQEMPTYVRSQFIPQTALFAGEWRPYLEELLSQDRPDPADVTGAAAAADVILERL
ncbi:MAG TPA: glycosyltransferase family protein [Vicinamibacterales bacterium]